jgi:hypothetical protein
VGPGRRGPPVGAETGAGARPGAGAVGGAGQRVRADRPGGAQRGGELPRCAPRWSPGTGGCPPASSTGG